MTRIADDFDAIGARLRELRGAPDHRLTLSADDIASLELRTFDIPKWMWRAVYAENGVIETSGHDEMWAAE